MCKEIIREGEYATSTGELRKRKVMISQPMKGIPEDEIIATRKRIMQELIDKDYEIIDSYFVDEFAELNTEDSEFYQNVPVYFLSKSLEKMSACDAVYFAKGFENARGCMIEHEVASKYGYRLIYEDYPFCCCTDHHFCAGLPIGKEINEYGDGNE